MKTAKNVILYKFYQDSFYSTIEVVECDEQQAEYLLSRYDDEYFRKFSDAKKRLKNYIKREIAEWQNALTNATYLTEKIINNK